MLGRQSWSTAILHLLLQAPHLGIRVSAGSALSAAFFDRGLEAHQGVQDEVSSRVPTVTVAFVDPLTRGSVAAGVIAPLACGDLVLDPTRATLDSWNDVFGCRRHQWVGKRSFTPDTPRTVSFEYPLKTFSSTDLDHAFRVADTRTVGKSTRIGHPGTLVIVAGRFAPSPSGRLHLGNLRTALAAWLAARSTGRKFYVRMEDLDPSCAPAYEAEQLLDLAALGLDWDPPVVRQSERLELYGAAIDRLEQRDLVYPCFCTRREIRLQIEQSTRAPHADTPDGAYPGTCRHLDNTSVEHRRRDRRPALRLRGGGSRTVHDRIAGQRDGVVDDVVLARADQLPAYNLAVVVDDHEQGVDQVVRADDLLGSTPRQNALYDLFGWEAPEYWHIPLVMDGEVRLAKRNGGVTLPELVAAGATPDRVRDALAVSLGVAAPGESTTMSALVDRFGPDIINRQPVQTDEIVAQLFS